MGPVAFVTGKFKDFSKWSQDFFNGFIHRRRDNSSRRNPIEILKRLQQEAFLDLMKFRDRQDKVERILSLYKTAKGSPFQEVGTVLRGEVDLLGALLMRHNVKQDECDVLSRAGIRTGVESRFSFEMTARENDNLVVEFVTGQKHRGLLVEEALGGPLSLAKVFYTANAGDWLSAFVIPMGGKCSDVAVVTNPSHLGKGLTGILSSGPPLLNLHSGSAIGLMVKKSNVVASLASLFLDLECLRILIALSIASGHLGKFFVNCQEEPSFLFWDFSKCPNYHVNLLIMDHSRFPLVVTDIKKNLFHQWD